MRHGGYQRHVKFTAVNALLTALGVVFAVIGIKAALDLFSASTYAELDSAQKTRTISNKVSYAFTLQTSVPSIQWQCSMSCSEDEEVQYQRRMMLFTLLHMYAVFYPK